MMFLRCAITPTLIFSAYTKETPQELRFEALDYKPHSPDLAPSIWTLEGVLEKSSICK